MIILDSRRWRLAAAVARSGLAVSAIGFGLALVGSTASIEPAWAAPTPGTAQIITPLDGSPGSGQPLAGGGSATQFSLALPPGAACSGDNLAGFTVQSYMVPTSVDLTALSFTGGNGPVPSSLGEPYEDFRQPLLDTTGTPYTNAFPAAATPPAVTGSVINIPAFSFMPFEPLGGETSLPAGDYNVGVACYGPTVAPAVDFFWSATIRVVEAAADPLGFTWTVQAAAAATSVTLAADPPSGAAPGAAVTLTATVTPSSAAGTVTFNDEGVAIGDPVAVAGGAASLTTSALAAGDHTLTATFTPTDTAAFARSTSTPLPYSIVAGGVTTTTTARGGASATTSTLATSVAAGGVGPSTGVPLGSLARTGGSLSLLVWGGLTLVFGRMVMLLGRKPTVRASIPT